MPGEPLPTHDLTDEQHPDNPSLRRIRALVDMPWIDVSAGDLGGWVHTTAQFGRHTWVAPGAEIGPAGGGKASVREAREAMGIDWMDRLHDLVEAIPPAYTEHIGRRLLQAVAR